MFVRPDWRNQAAYHAIEGASLQRIAWEFLRRNPDYQKAWAEYAGLVRKMAAPDTEVAQYVELVLSDCECLESWAALGDSTKTDALGSRLDTLGHFHLVADESPRYVALDLHCGTPWGLDRIANPGTNYDGLRVRFKESASTIPGHISNVFSSDTELPGDRGLRDTKWLALRVDLSLPLKVIDAQLKKVVRQQRQRKIGDGTITPIANRDVSPKKYVEYLRILDARASGLSAPQIGKIIEPCRINDGESRQRDKRYSAALKEAERLQKEGYRNLPLLDFFVRSK